MINIRVVGLDPLIKRMDQHQDKLNQGMQEAMTDSLLVMTESVPGYPSPPENSSYRRTGTLGRTLGSSVEGGKSGQPQIFSVTAIGGGWEGRFGTNLEYAPYVIGDGSQSKTHQKRWWVLSDVAEKAAPKIERVWQLLAAAIAKYLEGK